VKVSKCRLQLLEAVNTASESRRVLDTGSIHTRRQQHRDQTIFTTCYLLNAINLSLVAFDVRIFANSNIILRTRLFAFVHRLNESVIQPPGCHTPINYFVYFVFFTSGLLRRQYLLRSPCSLVKSWLHSTYLLFYADHV